MKLCAKKAQTSVEGDIGGKAGGRACRMQKRLRMLLLKVYHKKERRKTRRFARWVIRRMFTWYCPYPVRRQLAGDEVADKELLRARAFIHWPQ